MIEFIEHNIFWIVIGACVLFVAVDLFFSRKNLKVGNFRRNLNKFGKALEKLRWRDFFFGVLIFIGVFLLMKGAIIAQNEAQSCEVWISYDVYNGKLSGLQQGFIIDDEGNLIKENLELSSIDWGEVLETAESWENGRSNNYYRRKFAEIGGRPFFYNINCSFSFNRERFINNLMLDYNERGKQW